MMSSCFPPAAAAGGSMSLHRCTVWRDFRLALEATIHMIAGPTKIQVDFLGPDLGSVPHPGVLDFFWSMNQRSIDQTNPERKANDWLLLSEKLITDVVK